MLKAITYTALFCGASAGAAFALAFVHEAAMRSPVSESARVAPQPSAAPVVVEQKAIAVSFAPTVEREMPEQAPRVAPILPAAPQTVTVEPTPTPKAPAVRSEPARTTKVTPQPRYTAVQPRQVIGMSSQGARGEFAPTQFNRVLPEVEIARSVPLFDAAPGPSGDVGKTWSIGVYR